MGIDIKCDKCRTFMDSAEECFCESCIKELEEEVESLGEEVIDLEKKLEISQRRPHHILKEDE